MPRYVLHTKTLNRAAAEKGDHSRYAIAKRTGLAESTLSRLARGLASPTTKSLMTLAEAYAVSLGDLVQEAKAENSEAAAVAPAAASSERVTPTT
ncbi:helix-turn-helix domain-containing protein [Streptomyces sp. CC228A]|uniref:helix-turn-helix domain-containing protein n=1 Tax=Streptomyces sp. CC228A TaxID=2898186 RepID=UPI001F1B9EF8|nr:helix-turn-helix transcriptional regulator [Streptomyces sp. CC228A]